ncbi:hypothetical protein MHW47_00130 [Streptomyces sp. OfavH-34-F]|uniref:hypothetical protein n=1 Tax=Streptomyces sp. OfavH-34-F TaxID=2917760 RepID=UPI001EF2DD81|nr:hypothetical protein [Streptomyces sp. OfavH-34-F]MCG7522862.1 hypothetical protein [Streptomyces sp. OfavH-34-F]
MRSTRGLAAVIMVAIATLSAGCVGHASDGAGRTPGRASAVGTAAPDALPAGVTPLGSSVPVAAQGWNLELAPFTETSTGASAEPVPAGWVVVRTQARFTNTSGRIAQLPDTALTVRYGPLGRQATPVKDAVLTGLPARDAVVREAPGAAFTAEVGVAIPPQSRGQRVTVTAEATQQGMAEADNLFFEGTLPGKVRAAEDAGPPESDDTEAASASAVLPFGAWSPDRVRVSAITLGPAKNGTRPATADLTVVSSDSRPRTGAGITLRVMTGAGLKDAASLTPALDYPDAPIAPARPATVTVHFSLPATAVPGPVTVEAVDQGERITFSGTVS